MNRYCEIKDINILNVFIWHINRYYRETTLEIINVFIFNDYF